MSSNENAPLTLRPYLPCDFMRCMSAVYLRHQVVGANEDGSPIIAVIDLMAN